MRKQHLNVVLALPFAASVLGAGEAAAAPSACDAIAGNLVANCGFETTTGWSPSVDQVSFRVHTGSFAARLNGPAGSSPLIEQTITNLTIGDTYTLAFWVLRGDPGFNLDVSFGTTDLGMVLPPVNDTFEEFTDTVTASATSELLKFDSSASASTVFVYGVLDDVSLVVASSAPVPEPRSLALLATGLAGLTGLRRRRR